uniref:Uncharacterized protein n=1 Tax=Lactuca sativa TaxID=4236 RepID=A0A9R1XRZ3_LACSA|nr:hypothetical protein LSAT_V11C300105680 [Lactuca sativa]
MDDDYDDEMVLHALLFVAQYMVHERGESSHNEKKPNEPLVRDYFAPNSLYDLSKFEERFHISRNLFLRTARDLECNYEFFRLRYDVRGKRGFTTIQKCMVALRQLGYDIATDASDEYLKMYERTGRSCTYLFCEYVIELYRDIYLRHLTKSDVQQLYVTPHIKLNMLFQG